MTILFQNSDLYFSYKQHAENRVSNQMTLLFGSSKVLTYFFFTELIFFKNNVSIDKAIGGFWNK